MKKTLKHPKADEMLCEEFKIKIEKYKSEGRAIVYVDERALLMKVHALTDTQKSVNVFW